jgi:uncharacterized protein (DUF2141 family)
MKGGGVVSGVAGSARGLLSALCKVIVTVLLLAGAGLPAQGNEAPPEGLLTVEVAGLAGESGSVYIAVYNSAKTWLGDAPVDFRQVDIQEALDRELVVANLVLPVGEYALSVFYDVNANGELDTSFIGMPKEPIALSNDARAKFGPPRYSDAKFQLSLEPVIQRITMRVF